MMYLSVALVIIAAMAYKIADKWLDEKSKLNTIPDYSGHFAAVDEQLKKFDSRINDTWSAVSAIKEELNALRMQNAIKGR